jgi:hypothetical protein
MKRAIAASSPLGRPTSVRSGILILKYKETRGLVRLVTDGANPLRLEGEKTFTEFHRPGSRCRQDETYTFILDLQGDMLFDPDSSIEAKNEIGLKDFNGKPVIRELIDAGTAPAGQESHHNKIFSLKSAPARQALTLTEFDDETNRWALPVENTICANLTTLNCCAADDQSWLLPERSNLAPAVYPLPGPKLSEAEGDYDANTCPD